MPKLDILSLISHIQNKLLDVPILKLNEISFAMIDYSIIKISVEILSITEFVSLYINSGFTDVSCQVNNKPYVT